MSSTNKTRYYDLPQWVGSDKPTFLGDLNNAFLTIDTQIKNAADAAQSADAKAESVSTSISDTVTSVENLSSQVSEFGNQLSLVKAEAGVNGAEITTIKTDIANLKTATTNNQTGLHQINDSLGDFTAKDIELQAQINSMTTQIENLRQQVNKPLAAYPVGSIFLAANAVNPAAAFGGTWAKIASGRCLVGEGTVTDKAGNAKSFTLGETGGYLKTEVLAAIGTVNQATDTIGYTAGPKIDGGIKYTYTGNFTGSGSMTGTETHSTRVYERDGTDVSKVQPYLVVAIWQRTA